MRTRETTTARAGRGWTAFWKRISVVGAILGEVYGRTRRLLRKTFAKQKIGR